MTEKDGKNSSRLAFSQSGHITTKTKERWGQGSRNGQVIHCTYMKQTD